MIKAYLYRDQRPDCTIGGLQFANGFQCLTLELPWRNNEPEQSCIPEGVYACGLRPSARFGRWTGGMVYHLQPVQGRADILIHAGNTTRDTRGCILVGQSISDDLPTFLRNSRKTLIDLHDALGGESFTLTISS